MTRPTILAYHAVGAVDPPHEQSSLFLAPDVFARQMEFLARRCRVVPLMETIDHRFTRGQPLVAITFDDGYRCLLEHALPVLERHGFPATLFVPTGAIGDRNRWDDPPPAGLEVMTREELGEADARGLVVESHGHRHIHFATASEAEVTEDLTASVDSLRELLGRDPSFLAYPYGEVTPTVIDVAARLGFRSAFTHGTRDLGQFMRARVPIRNEHPAWFPIKSSGYWPALRFSRAGTPIRNFARGRRATSAHTADA